MYKFTTRIIAVSQDIADFIPKAWGVDRSKILCIKNSVYSDKYHIDKENRDIKKSDLGISNEKLVIGTVSVLRKVKNHKLLIETFARLYRKYPHLMLVVVGDYPLDDYRNVLIELVESYHLSDSVLFTGARADIPELMNIFDIYVNMSLFEGTSITILEALASGLPVVASDVGGNPELVKDGVTGFLFVSNDIDDFYMKIKKLLDDPSLRADISANAVDFIDSHYSYSKMISSYDGLYTSNE